jgi:hypothetical protein
LLATLIWFTIRFAIQHEISLVPVPPNQVITREFSRLRITVLTDAADPRVFQINPSEVSAVVRGEAALLRRLSAKDFHAFVNMIEIEDAKGIRKRAEVLCPFGVTLYKVTPTFVSVEKAVTPRAPRPTAKP